MPRGQRRTVTAVGAADPPSGTKSPDTAAGGAREPCDSGTQYFGTLGSTSSDHARMPPIIDLAFVNP